MSSVRLATLVIAWLDDHPRVVRLVLVLSAAALLLLGWLGAGFSEVEWKWLHDHHPLLRQLAAVPTTVWAAYEATRDVVHGRNDEREKAFVDQVDELLVELQDECARQNIASRTYHCGVIVWRLEELSKEDRKSGESRRPLERVASRPMRYRRSTSGLQWREGMGVAGVALAAHQDLGVDVHEVWGPLVDASQDEWEQASEQVRQGLTYEEFKRAVGASPSGLPNQKAGPFILAVPIWHGAKGVGVGVLDTPPEMKLAVTESKARDLLYALTVSQLEDQ
ncbi:MULTISPECIES: hypothetical protein [unclassified Knoellia]|uniref:hypothetical protein n=1 Tax=Knoellia altitudinis TaxID=3404795 RepID=UPI0036143649